MVYNMIGYCFNDEYKCINEYTYYGDYGDEKNTRVSLYQRIR